MKRILVVAALFMTAGLLFANGRAEKLDALEGTVNAIEVNGTKALLRLQLRDGSAAEVLVPEAELARLQIRLREQVRLEGVLVEGDEALGLQTRLHLRQATATGSTLKVEDPVPLRTQDRERLRLQTADGTATQTQTQTRTQAADGSGTGTGKK
jgi:hypothetical protein